MKRQDEYLDQRLGDFATSRYAANALQLQRLFDRYGLAFIRDYPQVLFENREQWRLPGWQYRGQLPEYTVSATASLGDRRSSREAEHAQSHVATESGGQIDPLTRLAAAYRVLDNMFTPSSEPSRQKLYCSRQGYAGAPRRGYGTGPRA